MYSEPYMSSAILFTFTFTARHKVYIIGCLPKQYWLGSNIAKINSNYVMKTLFILGHLSLQNEGSNFPRAGFCDWGFHLRCLGWSVCLSKMSKIDNNTYYRGYCKDHKDQNLSIGHAVYTIHMYTKLENGSTFYSFLNFWIWHSHLKAKGHYVLPVSLLLSVVSNV